MPEFTVVPHAAGATRILLSPHGRRVVAEVRGRWIREEYSDTAADIPGLLKVLDDSGAITKAVMGWPLGGPTDAGQLQYIAEGAVEGHLEVRTTGAAHAPVPLVPPDGGFWTVETTVAWPSGSCNAVIMSQPVKGHDYRNPHSRRTRLWIAVIDRATGITQVNRTLVATLATLGDVSHGVGVAAGPAHIAFVEVPQSRSDDEHSWYVTALQCSDLDEAWRVALPDLTPNRIPTNASQGPNGLPAPPELPLAATSASQLPAQSRVTGAGLVSFGGAADDPRVTVIRGIAGRVGVDLERAFVLSAKDGSVLHDVAVRTRSPVAELIPGPPTRVSMLLRERVRKGGSTRAPIFFGLRELDVTSGQLGVPIMPNDAAGVSADGMGTLLPMAHARFDTRFVLAPGSYAWVSKYMTNHVKGEQAWPSGGGIGAAAPEVANWLSIPAGWHRSSSRATQLRAAWLESQRRP